MHVPGRAFDEPVTAVYRNARDARRAIEALQADGIDAGRIRLARGGAPGEISLRHAGDAPILWRVVWRGFWWSVVGAIAGLAVGLVFGLNDFGLPGFDANLPLQLTVWGMFLHIAGALYGAYTALATGSAWEMTFGGADGDLALAVMPRDHRQRERITGIMRNAGAESLDEGKRT
jgi:hypothetical protein